LFIKHSSSLHRQEPAQGTNLPPSADAAPTKTTGRKIRRRPHISLTLPREWNRPISPGVLPVYDEALRIIQADSATLKSEADYCRNQLQQAEAAVNSDPATLQQLRDKLYKLEVESEVNLPDVRWKFRNGMGKCSNKILACTYSDVSSS
jgi:large subunit ribosomal protein L35